MDWLKKKKEEKKQRLLRVKERGAKLLEDLIECCDGKSNPIKFFSADQIIKATNNFSESNLISEMNVRASKWYSGNIYGCPAIFLRGDAGGDYCRNIAISSMVSGHKNFLKLLGCCLELEEPIIVYNYIKISSLFKGKDRKVVSWKRRMKIIEEIATALAYLHTAFPRPFVYRALSPESIVLDEDGVARLCDFSFCISIPQGETFVQVDKLEGTIVFVDANYHRFLKVSEKTDVFAIGNIMLMVLSGKERFYELSEMDPRWRYKYMEEEELRMDKIADLKMLENRDEVGEEDLCQMKAFLMLSLRCIGRTNWEIPNMVEVAKDLKNIQRYSFPSSASGETIIVDYARNSSF